MLFRVSPGVDIKETSLTTIIPSVATTEAATVGRFNWGPVLKRVLVSSEETLVNNFSKPDDNTATDFFVAADTLAYGNRLYVTRVNNGANNATASGNTSVQVLNDDDYYNNYYSGIAAAGDWVGKYPGTLGNSVGVSICQSAAAWESTLSTVTLSFTANSTTVTSTANMEPLLVPGDSLYFANSTITVNLSVTAVSNDEITVATAPTAIQLGASSANVANTVNRRWKYFDYFNGAPGTSTYATNKGGSNDELHIIVVDEDGEWTGTKGDILERYDSVSRANDAKLPDGSSNYYKEKINKTSAYVWWSGHNAVMTSAGSGSNTIFTVTSNLPQSVSLSGGSNGSTVTDGQKITAFDLYRNPEDVDVSFLVCGEASAVVDTYVINNIAEVRKDCMAVISPLKSNVVDNALYGGSEAISINTFKNQLPSSSYYTFDSGWKYRYDKYNDVFRWVPVCSDVTGLMIRTDSTRDPWYSPAGFNRGRIKNVTKLAYNPTPADRDLLYKNNVNPIVTFRGEGTVLYGDKTGLSKPDAFDRINVRRLFIVLEKAIATAAKFSLFEFNDEETRAAFRNAVNPYLRNVQGRRGITDFRVVCDATNNTPTVIDNNSFVASIFIKPNRSINEIQLNFIATPTGVEFEEIVGSF